MWTTLAIATIASMVSASVLVMMLRGDLTWSAPLIAALCCLSTAGPVHFALRGYYRMIIRHKQSLEHQTLKLEELNEKLSAVNYDLMAFSHRVAHDLRNPLTVIRANAQLLADHSVSVNDEFREGCVSDIALAGQNAEQIINAILLLSQARLAPPELKPVDLYLSLEGALSSLQLKLRERDITVRVVRGLEPQAWAHPPWLVRIWVNLIDNAIKHAGQQPRIEVGARLDNGRIRCWVSDDGPGVPENVREHIFKEFQQHASHVWLWSWALHGRAVGPAHVGRGDRRGCGLWCVLCLFSSALRRMRRLLSAWFACSGWRGCARGHLVGWR